MANPCYARKVGADRYPPQDHFVSEVGITSANADWGGQGGGVQSTLTLEVKLVLPLAMMPQGGVIDTHFGSEVGIASGNADLGGGVNKCICPPGSALVLNFVGEKQLQDVNNLSMLLMVIHEVNVFRKL